MGRKLTGRRSCYRSLTIRRYFAKQEMLKEIDEQRRKEEGQLPCRRTVKKCTDSRCSLRNECRAFEGETDSMKIIKRMESKLAFQYLIDKDF